MPFYPNYGTDQRNVLSFTYMQNTPIRKAIIDDLKAIQELNYELFLYEEKHDNTLDMQWPHDPAGEHYFKEKIAGQGCVCFVAEIDGKIVGYLAGGITKSESYRTVKKITELENTLVSKDFRGQKIGEQLFAAFSEWSKQNGAEKIKVTASAGNAGAIRFYEKVGFAPYVVNLEYTV